MKSTVRIDYERGPGNDPVIKIVTLAADSVDEDHPDFRVEDKLIGDFLQPPSMGYINTLFEQKTRTPIDGEKKLIVTIGPITRGQMHDTLRYRYLNRYVPQPTLNQMQKAWIGPPAMTEEDRRADGAREPQPGELVAIRINKFFDWLKSLDEPGETGFSDNAEMMSKYGQWREN
jgi:hypothetical protein